MVNDQWLNLYKEARVEFLSIIGSDDGLILFKLDNWDRTSKFPSFRFEAKWLLHDNFMKLVNQTWKRFINRSSTYQLVRKIEILKKERKS